MAGKEDRLDQLYNSLTADGAQLGDKKEFRKYMTAPGDQGYKNRYDFWKALSNDGAKIGNSYEEFRDIIGFVAKQKPQSQSRQQQTTSQPQATQVSRPKTTMELAKDVGFGNFNPKDAVMPSYMRTQNQGAIDPQTGKVTTDESRVAAPVADKIMERKAFERAATGQFTEDETKRAQQYGQQLKDELDYATETGGGRLQDGKLLDIPGQVNTLARDEEGNILRNDEGQLLRGITNDESRVQASRRYNEDVDKAIAEDESFSQLQEKIINEEKALREQYNKMRPSAERDAIARSLDDYRAARRTLIDADELISEIHKQRSGSNDISTFFRNVWDGIKKNNIIRVISDIGNNSILSNAIEQYEQDPSKLTESQKILLDAAAMGSLIQQEYGSEHSRAAKAGQTTGASVLLMADIAMNPLSGLGKSMAKAVGKNVLKNAAKKAVASGAQRAISNGASRAARFAAAGGNLAGNIVSAAGMTATVSSPRVISDAQQRMIGDIQSEYDENGLLRFKGTEGGDNAFDAYRKAFTANMIENFTEIQSSMLLGTIGMMGKTFPGVRNALNGFKATKLGQMWNAAGRSQLGRMARNVAERTGLHDFPGESLEEIEGGILNALFVGDQTIADTFEQDNLIDIGLGVAPMQLFFGAVNMGGYGIASRRAKRALRNADEDGQRVFGEDEWGQMKQTIDQTKDVNELKSVLSNVVNGGQYSTQAKQAAFRYAAAREGYKGAVLGEAAARELDFGKNSRVESFTVDGKTVTTFDKDGKELTKKTFDTDDEVQGYMTEIKMHRKNDDMLSDIEAVQKKATKREALIGEVGYTAAFSDEEWQGLMWEAMQQAGYDESRGQDDPTNQAIAANVLQVGTMENDIFKEVVNKYNPLQRLHHNIAESYGISDGELQRILDKDPMHRTEEQQHIVDAYAEQLHQIAYEPGTLHTEQSAQDGASAADDADGGTSGIDPEVLRTEKERYDAAIAARDEALKNNQAMAMRIEELQSYGVDTAGIIAELGDFDEEDVKAVIEGYNAEYRWQSFLDKANKNFEATTQREVDRRTFKGTLNGAEQKENMVNVTDGENTYTLVGGDVTTDADGRVTGGGNANALVVLDDEGNMVVLHPENTLTVMPGDNLAAWGTTFLQQLQEGSTAAAGLEAPSQSSTTDEGAQAAGEEAATESPQTEQGAEGAPAAEQPAEGTPVGEQPAGEEPAEGEGEQPVIPTNEHGRKLYHQGVDLDVAIDDILKEEAPDNDVNALADRRIKTAQRKLDDLNKDNKKLAKQFEDNDFDDDEYDDVRAARRGEELPYGTKLGVYAQQRIEQEAIINYYNKLKTRYAARRAAEILAGEGATGGAGSAGSAIGAVGAAGTGGAAETGGEENVPDWTVDKASDARARGYRMENGHRVDRNSPVYGEEGNEVEVKFDKAEEPVKGKWVVFDEVDDFLVPSHVNGQRNVRYFITEAQPKERTDADSDNSSTAIAEHVNPEEITSGVTAYTGAPVVNSRGEVIQGNNRTIGLQKMWGSDAYGESQQKYKQYLMDHAEEFGLDAAAIEQIEKPVLVRMIDVSDDEAIRLGQKTAANTESGGVERIDAGRVLNQMGDKFDTFIRLLFAGAEDEDLSLMGLIAKNGVSVLKWLNDGRNHAKFITDTEYQSCFDKKGNLTEEAKQDLQKIVEGMLFADAPDNLREMFYRLPAKAQNAILATFYRDAQSPDDAKIIKDIQNAIEAFEVISNASPEFKAAKSVNDARVAVKDVQKQTAMFGNTGTILEKFDNFALELAIIFKAMKQNTIRDYFNAYYDAVQGKGGDIFSEAVTKTKAEAIKDIFGVETNNNQEENGQEGNGPLEGGSNDGTGGQPGNAGESGNGEPPAQGEQPTVGGGGTAGTGEVSEREQYIANHPLTEAEIDASDAPQMRKNLAKGYLNGSNDSQLAKAAYTSIYNKKGKGNGTATESQPTGQAEAPQGGQPAGEAPATETTTGEQPSEEQPAGEAPQGETPTSGEQPANGSMSAATAAANAKVQAILARMKAHGKNDEDNDIDHDDISSRNEQSYTDKNGNYHEGLKEEAERLEDEIAASSVPASEELDDKSQQGETVERRRRRALIEDELARRESARQALRQRYDIDKDGNISLDNLARMFRDLNSNAAIGKLFDKVYAVLKKLRVDFRFTEKLPGGVNGRALGFVNVTFYSWDAQTQNISNQQKAKILLHEMIHNVTLHILVYYKNATTRALLTPSQISAAKKLNAIYKRVKEISPKRKNGKPFYGLDEVDEMVSELANPEFREALDRIEYENKTIWQKIKDAVKEMLGFAVSQRKEKALKGVEDALDAILDSYGVFGRIIHAGPRSLIDIVKKLMHDNVSIVDEMESDMDDYFHKNLIVEDADEYSITGLTDEQIDDMLELVEAGAELGYTLLDGVQTKDEWTAQMRGLIGESLKDATGYTDAEVDELLEDLWNAPYENEWGDTNTIAEYAAEKGIITTNNNNNGTEEGTGNGDTGTSGSNTVGSGAEGGVGENAPNNGGSTGTGGETGSGTNTSGSNSGSGEGRPSSGTGRTRKPGTPVANNGGSTGGSNTNRGSNKGKGTNDSGGTQSSGEQPAVSGANSGVGQPERVEPKKPLADVSQEKTPYVPASIGGKYAIGSVVPSGVADAIAQAFNRLREQHKKEILDFVRDELGYSSNEEMLSDFDSGKTDGLAAEQVDAVALAISAMKSGKSFIVGDMTGVGKGRTAAALIRWGKKQGKKVLFITERSSLFSDMHRDLTDIGCDYMPFVTNNDTDANITDSEGNKVIPKPNASAQSALWQRDDDILPTDKKGRQYDFVMTTYSQASNPRGANAKNKLEWLSRYAKDAIVIMDESHNASGESNRGEYFKEIVKGAEGVTFLSATYAKRPDNMLLYALRSSMSETHMSTGDMLQAIKDYGVPMQEIMAAALYGSGEMIRRERDMSDVKTTWTDPKVIYSEEEYEQCRKTSDKTMDLVNDIIDFQRDFIDPIVKAHEEDYKEVNKFAELTGDPQTHASNTPYSSQVSNVVNLMVYAMKAKKAAQMAIEQIKQGKKPVIAVENTLESYVKELDDDVREAGFGPIFEKGVKFSLKYSIAKYVKKDGKYEKDKESEVIYDAESELDEDGKRALENLRKRVADYVADKEKVDLSLSPIDLIKQMIADAGYNCGEITGRSYQLERKADGNGFWKTPFKAKKKDVARKFNGGSVENPLPKKEQYQALILNVAGATGISLHSSKKFGNQQPRTMIILQPARDVNIEVQMRGRIDRTGQVHRGEYFYVTSPIPAEQKMTMMLRQKLASLDAQSVGTKDVSSNKVESQDMDNKYGDEVCYQFLLEHLNDINAYLDNGLRYNNKTREWESRPGLLYDVMKNLQRMPCEMQEMVINELTQRYQDQIDYLNQNGINDLETTTMNLEAVTIDKATFVKGKDNDSINEFAHDTTIERVEVNVLKKPMRSSDIKKKMKELDSLDEDGLPKGGMYGEVQQKVQAVAQQKYDDRKAKYDEQENALEDKIRAAHPKKDEQTDEEWETMVQNWPTLLEMRNKHRADLSVYATDLENQKNAVYKAALYLKPGRPYLVPLTDDVSSDSMSMYGRFIGFQIKNGDPRQVQAVFAVKDSRSMISVPIVNQQKIIEKILDDRGDTEITALERTEWGDDLSMEEKAKKWDEWWDKMIPKNTNRQIRYMVTGNILQACGSLGKYKGQIVTFTRKNKETGEITLERGMLLAENFDPENFKIRRAVVKKDVWDHYDEVKDEKSNISCSRQGNTLIIKFEKRKGEKLADHPANKDDALKALAMNGEIRPSGKTAIMCVVKEENVEKALEHLYKEYGYTKEELFVMPDSTEKPDAIVRTNRPYQEVIDELGPKYGSQWLLDSKIKKMLKRYRMDVNNEGLKQEIREAVQLRQAYLRKDYAKEESNRLAWSVLIEDERIANSGDDKDYRERHMRIREAMLEELEFRGFKGTALHLEQGKMTFDDVRNLFDQMNDASTEEGKAKKALFEKVMAKVSKLPMDIALDETIDNNTGGWAGGRVIHYNWKYMNADYIANQAKADTILHELIHTVTAYAVRCVDEGYEHLLDQDMIDGVNELNSIYNALKGDPTFTHNGVEDYGLFNVKEMLSEAGSNSQFREGLKKTGLWAKMKSGFLTFFGIKQNVQGAKKTIAYDEIMRILDDLIENFNQEAWEEYYKGTRYGGYQRMDAQRNGGATESQQTQQRIEDDVEQNGLRGAVGDESYRKYMRDLWSAKGNSELHEWVTEHLAENDFNLYATIDKYLQQAVENGDGSQEMWENVRDGLKEATGQKRMSLQGARWLSWLNGRKGNRNNPDDSMKKNAVRWRIGRRRDMARLTPDGRSYAGVGPDVDMTDEMSVGNTPSSNLAKLWYHQQLDRWSTQWTEAHVDYAVSMKKLMFALTGARDVYDVKDDENFYVAENHMSSIITQREFQFMRDHWTPLQNAVDACLPDLDSNVEKAMSALEDYMRAKHGLERNREFFVRDWILAAEKAQQRGLKNAPTKDLEQLRQDWELEKRTAWNSMQAGRMTYRQYLDALDDFIKREIDADWDSSLLKNDRSGIRNYATQTDDAFEENDVISDVEDVERVLGNKADALWKAINDVTDYSLDSDYESGLISKENRDHVGQMFHFYVPLRGFNEKVANEVYDYMGIPVSNPVGLATLMKAKGRKSLSDSPLAVMGAMATSAISRGERNKVKQKMLRLVRNRYDAKNKERLVSLSKIWLENIGTEDNPIWEERWPEFDENDSADEIARKVDDFNKDMEQKRAAGMAMPRRANLRIPYRAKEAEKRQHMVEVKENGESYLVIINGDPRAAQAMNGLLTPGNADKNHTLGLLRPVLGPLNRFLSSAFTTWNPTFVLRNTLRDAVMSRSVVLTKEGEGYLMRFRANWYRLLWPELLNGRLWKKYRNGTLDENNFLEKCFKEFMEGGGETGYVEQKNVDKWRKMLLDGSKQYARKHGGMRRRVAYSTEQFAKAAVGLIEDYNERAENLARFATYLTSRQIGRSQLRCVADAKDVSVNFNRKGAGGSSADKNFLAGITAELFKSLYLFYNAGMQSLALMARNIKNHPVRFMRAQFANHFVMGVTIVLLNKWLVSVLGDDDTAENPYANLPEWTRRNNLCFFVGGKSGNDFVTIPLPIELRAFYGLGDIAAGYFVDPELKSLKNPAEDFIAQLSQILPVDFMGEGGDVLSAFVPDAVKPFTQIKNNKDWTGKPIQKKETEWNKYDPEWTKAFSSTDANAVAAARWLSHVTGGDDVKPGLIDISPAYAMHLLKGYTGGLGQTVTEVGGIIRNVATWDFEDFNSRNTPLLKAVYNQSDDRTAFYRTRAKFYKYVEDVKESKNYISKYKKKAEDPLYTSKLIQMMQKDALKNSIIDKAQKDMKGLHKAGQGTDRDTKKMFDMTQNRIMEQAVKAIEEME